MAIILLTPKIVSVRGQEYVRRYLQKLFEFNQEISTRPEFSNRATFKKSLSALAAGIVNQSGYALAIDGGELVGWLQFKIRGNRFFQIKYVFVRPESRGAKNGLKLVDAALSHARRLGFENVQINTIERGDRLLERKRENPRKVFHGTKMVGRAETMHVTPGAMTNRATFRLFKSSRRHSK
jgi:GNAT superfamily N-acetyltransferase